MPTAADRGCHYSLLVPSCSVVCFAVLCCGGGGSGGGEIDQSR